MTVDLGPKRFLPPGGKDSEEWTTHMNRYLTHPEEYPYTESVQRQWYKPLLMEIHFKVEFNVPVSSGDPSREEVERAGQKIQAQFLTDIKTLSLGEVLEKYGVDAYSGISITRHKTEWKLYTAKCVKCGELQHLELYPLSVDRDYWKCVNCGQLHSHIRPGVKGS